MSETCANCPEDARYRVDDPGANPLNYCARCLPPHLHVRARSGHFADPNVTPEPAQPRTRRKKQ